MTGLTAANLVVDQAQQGRPAVILDVEGDEAHIVAGRFVNRTIKGFAKALGIDNPFLF